MQLSKRNRKNRVAAAPPKSPQAAKPDIEQQSRIVAARSQHYSGPIPPAEMLEHFERIQAGLADRIVAMAEEGLAQQRKALNFEGAQRILGQVFAFILTMTGLGLGSYLLANGIKLGGMASLLSAIAIIVNSILRGRRKPKSESK